MQVGVRICWKVVVNCDVDFLDINATAKDVRCNADTLLEVFEFFVTFDTFCLSAEILLHNSVPRATYRSS